MDEQGTPVLGELRQFLEFLRNLWAMLAGISVLFPLSNVLVQVVPLARWTDGGLVYLPPPLVAALSTLACGFVVLTTFGRRREVADTRRRMRRQAGLSFVGGIAALAVYLTGHYAVANDVYFLALGWESGDLRRLAGDLILLAAYAAFFCLVTRAFMLLGLIEFYGAHGPASPVSSSENGTPP